MLPKNYNSTPMAGAPGFGSGQKVPDTDAKTNEEKDQKEIERLRSMNGMYLVYKPDWELYLGAYEGGADFIHDGNIFKHEREDDTSYKNRVSRAHYLNYCGPIVDFFTQFMFAEVIQRDGGENKDFFETFIKNVNLKGDDINTYMQQVSDDFQIFGMTYDEVSAPLRPDVQGELTKQHEQDFNLRPYWVRIHPDEVINWSADQFDVFTYLKRRQIIEQVDNTGTSQTIERYTEYYTDRYEVSEVDVTDGQKAKLITKREKTTNELGVIPIVVTRYKRSKRYTYMGDSFLRDLARNNRAILNLTSILDEFLYKQCFNMLAKQMESVVPSSTQEEGVMSESNILEYPKGADAPSYISPPVAPAKFLQDERDRIKQEMFRRAAQDTLNELFNGEKASGFSQAQSFSKTVPFIAGRADILERTEMKLMDLTMRYMSKTWDGTIKYKDRYDVTNLQDALTQLMTLARDMQLPSPTFMCVELLRLIDQFDGKLTSEQKAQVTKEVTDFFKDKSSWAQWEDIQKQALIGQNKPEGKSPGAQQKPKGTGTMAEAAAESTQAPGSKKVV